jgi:hypothetical protein
VRLFEQFWSNLNLKKDLGWDWGRLLKIEIEFNLDCISYACMIHKPASCVWIVDRSPVSGLDFL